MKTRTGETSRIGGRQAVTEALKARWPVYKVLISSRVAQRMAEVVRLAEDAGVEVSVLDESSFRARCPASSQGVCALIREVRFRHIDELLLEAKSRGEDPLLLAVDGVEDPQNLGAMARTALSLGVHGMVLPRRRVARLGEGAAKSSAGAIFHLPVAEVPNVHWFVRWAKENGLWVYGLDAEGTVELWTHDFSGAVAIVVGGEGRGLSSLVKKNCDVLVRIPMTGPLNSLNASVAAALALYEVRRQRITRSVR